MDRFTNHLKADKFWAEGWFINGMNHLNSGNLVIAIGHFHKYLSITNDYRYAGKCWHYIGFCILKYCEYYSSISFLRNSIACGFDERNLWLHIGEAYMRSSKFKQAFNCLRKAVSSQTHSPDIDLNRLYSFFFRSIENMCKKPLRKLDCLEAVADQIKKNLDVENIVCVGDSHVLLLENILGLDVFQTGSPTAYNLLKEDSTESGILKIREIIRNFDPARTAIIFTYCEIDIRVHLYKQAVNKDISYKEIAQDVVGRYMKVMEEFDKLGYHILVNGPFGTGIGVPRFGNEPDRNYLAFLIDSEMQSLAETSGYHYASLFDLVVSPNYKTNRSFVGDVDDNHLDKNREISFCLLSRFLSSISRKKYLDYIPDKSQVEVSQNCFCILQDECLNVCTFKKLPGAGGQPLFQNLHASYKYSLLISLNNYFRITCINLDFFEPVLFGKLPPEIELLNSEYISKYKTSSLESANNTIANSHSFRIASNEVPIWAWYLRISFSDASCLKCLTNISVFGVDVSIQNRIHSST
jgi:tetratricopeptide (TPR) repeat protein